MSEEEHYIILKDGNWSKKINVDEFKYGFANDIYYDLKLAPGTIIDRTGRGYAKNWNNFEKLLQWEDVGMGIFLNDKEGRELRNKTKLPLVYYSSVSSIASELGIRLTRYWKMFTVVDSNMNEIEKYNFYRDNGSLIIRHRASITTSPNVGILYDTRKVIKHINGALPVLEGIAHNAFVTMITEGKGRGESVFSARHFSAVQHNRYSGSGMVSSTPSLVSGLNWSYINWNDIVILCNENGIDTQLLPNQARALAGLIPINSLVWSNVLYENTVTIYALPILYWRIFSEQSDDVDLSSVGLNYLVSDKESSITTYIPVVYEVNKSILKQLLIYVPNQYKSEFVPYLRKWMGKYAITKIHDILNQYAENNNLDEDDEVYRIIDAIEEEVPVLDDEGVDPANDISGWYLSTIPSIDEQQNTTSKVLGRWE